MEKVGADVPKTDESDVGISSINKEVGMKKSVLTIRALVIPALLILGGCTGGVDEEAFNSLQAKVDELTVSTARVSAISAYDIWYSQYYGLGTYAYESVKEFNVQLGKLIHAVGDADTISVWNNYLTEDFAYHTLIEELPEDNSTWTSIQYDNWISAGTARANALGQVGGYLFTAANQ